MSKRFTITLPDDVYQALSDQASRDERTLSHEISYLLRQRLMTSSMGPGAVASSSIPAPTPTYNLRRKEI